MRNGFTVRFTGYGEDSFRIDNIAAGRISCVLPLSVVKKGRNVFGIYSTDKFRRLSDIFFDAREILDISSMIFRMNEELKDHLIFPERTVFNTNNIFISEDRKLMKMAYIPEVARMSEMNRITYVIRQLAENTGKTGRAYTKEVIRLYNKHGRDLYGLIYAINDMKREL